MEKYFQLYLGNIKPGNLKIYAYVEEDIQHSRREEWKEESKLD